MKRLSFLPVVAAFIIFLVPLDIAALDYDWRNPLQPDRLTAGPTESEPWGELESAHKRTPEEEISNWQTWWLSFRIYLDIWFSPEDSKPVRYNVIKSADKIDEDNDLNENLGNIEENEDSHSGTDPS